MSSSNTATKVGHGLAKFLGIKLQYRDPTGEENLTRGESVFSVSTADTFVEQEPTSLEWIRDTAPTGRTFKNWAYGLFPFTHWITRYNTSWLVGDLVAGQSPFPLGFMELSVDWKSAGITVGCVVVPQSMAYAKLALLPVQFGLYSSFMGVLIYWFFATSKDITIGVSQIRTPLLSWCADARTACRRSIHRYWQCSH